MGKPNYCPVQASIWQNQGSKGRSEGRLSSVAIKDSQEQCQNGRSYTSLVPDIAVQPTIEGIRAGRDEVLERAEAYLEKGR